ncbi:MAG: hypothetical protein QNL33_08710 [Akkermansiaceae bacterium]|jgi:hypothetical protein
MPTNCPIQSPANTLFLNYSHLIHAALPYFHEAEFPAKAYPAPIASKSKEADGTPKPVGHRDELQ